MKRKFVQLASFLSLVYLIAVVPTIQAQHIVTFQLNLPGESPEGFTTFQIYESKDGVGTPVNFSFPLPPAIEFEVEAFPAVFWSFFTTDDPQKQEFCQILYVMQEEVIITGQLDNPREWVAETGYEKQPILSELMTRTVEDDHEAQLAIIAEHPDLYMADATLYFARKKVSSDQIRSIYEKLPEHLQQSQNGKQVLNYLNLAGEELLEVGDFFQNLTGLDTEGQEHQLQDLVGEKWVLLEFSSAGCGPCSQAVPELERMSNEMEGELEVVSVWDAPHQEMWQRMVHLMYEGEVTFNDWWETSLEGFHRYQVNSFPTYFLINPDGYVTHRWSGYGKDQLTDIVKKKISTSMQGDGD